MCTLLGPFQRPFEVKQITTYATVTVCIETQQEYLNFENSFIHHFHIDHNAPCLPPKFCITIVFYFSWDDYNTQEKLETMVMQNLGRGGWGGKQDACIVVYVKMVNALNEFCI